MMFRIWCKGSLEFPRELSLNATEKVEVSNENAFFARPKEDGPENIQFLAKAAGDGYFVLAWDEQCSIWNEISYK